MRDGFLGFRATWMLLRFVLANIEISERKMADLLG